MNSRQILTYLCRIGHNKTFDVSASTLRGLHRAHLLSVPFENLDIHLHRPIVLDETALFEKIVNSCRGGFCYELNGLFAALLRDVGFKVTMLSAGVSREEGGFGPEFDHLVLLVQLRDRWIADVGFDELMMEPLLLDNPGAQKQGTDTFRIIKAGDHCTLLRLEAKNWKPQYQFTLKPHKLEEYSAMCVYHQTSPRSSFTQGRICSIAREDGRIKLTGKKLIITINGEREERFIGGEEEFEQALREYFGITLS